MSKFTKNLNLKEGEVLVKVVRQSPWAFLGSEILVTLLIITPFFFLFPLFSWGLKGKIIFFLTLAIGIIYGLRKFILWYLKIFIITNLRIIDVDQEGIFQRTVSEVSLEKISDVFYKIKGMRQTIFRYGIIRISIKEGQQVFEIRNISKPHHLQQLILRLQSEVLKSILDKSKLSAQELVKLVKKIKEGLGEEKFKEIIGDRELDNN